MSSPYRVSVDEAADRLSYGTELAESLSALVTLWWSPEVRRVLVDAAGEELGVTEARIIWELGRRQTIRPGALAALLEIGAPSVSKATAKLRMRGLVVTGSDVADSRSRPIQLSPTGVIAARHLYEIGDTLVGRVVSGWDEEEVAVFASQMARFLRDALPLAKQEAWQGDVSREAAEASVPLISRSSEGKEAPPAPSDDAVTT